MDHTVRFSKYDSTRPWIVVACPGTLNPVKGRYRTEAQANRRARDLRREA